MVAFGSGAGGASLASGVPSSKQKFRERSVYVRLQVGQRFMVAAKIIEKPAKAQALIGFPQRPQNFVPAG
jgi:hypothetical protein